MKQLVLYISCMLPVTKETIRELTINAVIPMKLQHLECEFIINRNGKVIFGDD
jgi:hypothetical protein